VVVCMCRWVRREGGRERGSLDGNLILFITTTIPHSILAFALPGGTPHRTRSRLQVRNSSCLSPSLSSLPLTLLSPYLSSLALLLLAFSPFHRARRSSTGDIWCFM